MKMVRIFLAIICLTQSINGSSESRQIIKKLLQNSINPSFDLLNTENVTEQCRKHSELLKNAVNNLEMWALKSMLNY
jgi:hypothetical protein